MKQTTVEHKRKNKLFYLKYSLKAYYLFNKEKFKLKCILIWKFLST